MTAAQTHQLLHGYSSGHGQIAASIKLPVRDSELVTRMSDLSGSLSSGLQVESYLTVYPLPSRSFFAVARTWPDPDAPRAGCVLTHTLLIPAEAWGELANVRSLDALFRNPRLHPEYIFTEAINFRSDGQETFKNFQARSCRLQGLPFPLFWPGLATIIWFNAGGLKSTCGDFWNIYGPSSKCIFVLHI